MKKSITVSPCGGWFLNYHTLGIAPLQSVCLTVHILEQNIDCYLSTSTAHAMSIDLYTDFRQFVDK